MYTIHSHRVNQKLQPRIGNRAEGRWDSHASGKKKYPVDRWSWESLKTSKTSSSKESATQPHSGLSVISLLSVVYSVSLPEAICSGWFVFA